MSVTRSTTWLRDPVMSLATFAAFPSISSAPEHSSDVRACARWLAAHLETAGLEGVELCEIDDGNPIVYGHWLHAPSGAPTALVYGHYDVQPADPLELWTSPPFKPEVREGRLYARGASDNKGQIIANVAAIERLLAQDGTLPCNVKVIFEGEEELRADRFEEFVAHERERLSCDLVVVCDVGMHADGVPSVPLGLRGQCALQITVQTARTDLHSGLYGGAVPNALHALVELLATLHDRDGRVAVPGFYDDVAPVDSDELQEWARLEFDQLVFEEEFGGTVFGEPGHSTLERLWSRPTIELHGVWGGFLGTGLKTVIPREATATMTCRLVPEQRPDVLLEVLETHLRKHLPESASMSVNWRLIGSWPFLLSANHPAVGCALDALAEAFGERPVITRMGWSVPAAEILKRGLQTDVLLLGFALPDEQAHAPDEHFSLDHLERGIITMAAFWRRLSSTGSLRRAPAEPQDPGASGIDPSTSHRVQSHSVHEPENPERKV